MTFLLPPGIKMRRVLFSSTFGFYVTLLVVRHLSNMSIATSHDSTRKINKKILSWTPFCKLSQVFKWKKLNTGENSFALFISFLQSILFL